LVGDNTYTGVTTLTGGSLRVFKLADIGQASGIGAGDATSDTTNAASLVLNGGTLDVNAARTLANNNPISLAAASAFAGRPVTLK
jgi:fibronectin-binding autotransporter adhesin